VSSECFLKNMRKLLVLHTRSLLLNSRGCGSLMAQARSSDLATTNGFSSMNYEVLRDFCEAYNDQPMDAIEHEGTLIRHIDFEAILQTFFWDLDFTIPFEELSALGEGGRDMMGIHDQALNAANGFVPHPDESNAQEEFNQEQSDSLGEKCRLFSPDALEFLAALSRGTGEDSRRALLRCSRALLQAHSEATEAEQPLDWGVGSWRECLSI